MDDGKQGGKRPNPAAIVGTRRPSLSRTETDKERKKKPVTALTSQTKKEWEAIWPDVDLKR